MDSRDSESLEEWSQLMSTLDEINGNNKIDVQLLDNCFQNKCKELNQTMKDMKKLSKEKIKLELELEKVDKSLIKAQNNISKAEDKCQQIEEYNNKLLKKTEENKENFENVMNVWNTIGLRVEKEDQVLTIKFSKIADKDPNKWFTVRVSLKEQNKIKVVDCDPKESLDCGLVEEHFNQTNGEEALDLRYLIAFIRNDLKRRQASH